MVRGGRITRSEAPPAYHVRGRRRAVWGRSEELSASRLSKYARQRSRTLSRGVHHSIRFLRRRASPERINGWSFATDTGLPGCSTIDVLVHPRVGQPASAHRTLLPVSTRALAVGLWTPIQCECRQTFSCTAPPRVGRSDAVGERGQKDGVDGKWAEDLETTTNVELTDETLSAV